MEYIETTIGKLAKYNQLIEKWIKRELPLTMENEEYLKPFRKYLLCFEMISKLLYPNNSHSDYLTELLNELYTSLRKINFSLTDYHKSSLFSQDKGMKGLKACLARTQLVINAYHNTLKYYFNKNESNIPQGYDPGKPTRSTITFYLSIKNQVNLPMSCENIFVNMVQYKDMVYYVETSDLFSFFYFYRTEECWFWSPPKKTDPEDIWIECPDVKINEGYWKGEIIPEFMADYIVWLDLFFPNIPEFYIKKEKAVVKGKKAKSNKNNSDNNDKDKKNCSIF